MRKGQNNKQTPSLSYDSQDFPRFEIHCFWVIRRKFPQIKLKLYRKLSRFAFTKQFDEPQRFEYFMTQNFTPFDTPSASDSRVNKLWDYSSNLSAPLNIVRAVIV